jgi:DNA-binding transcriptional regulator YiaG
MAEALIDGVHMPNLGTVLKEEIARVCRKEIRQRVEPLRKASAAQRREMAALKRKVATLERQAAMLEKQTTKMARERVSAEPDRPMRFVAKGLVSLRARLGLSAEDFGRLAGVSGQSIYNWEKGKTTPRKEQLTAVASLRGLSKREAAARLAARK